MILALVAVERNIKNVAVNRRDQMLELEKYNGVLDSFRQKLDEVGVSL